MSDILQMGLTGLSLGLMYALIAIGLTLIFGVMRIIQYAHGEMFMLGAFSLYYWHAELGLPYWPGVAVSARADLLRRRGAASDAVQTLAGQEHPLLAGGLAGAGADHLGQWAALVRHHDQGHSQRGFGRGADRRGLSELRADGDLGGLHRADHRALAVPAPLGHRLCHPRRGRRPRDRGAAGHPDRAHPLDRLRAWFCRCRQSPAA